MAASAVASSSGSVVRICVGAQQALPLRAAAGELGSPSSPAGQGPKVRGAANNLKHTAAAARSQMSFTQDPGSWVALASLLRGIDY